MATPPQFLYLFAEDLYRLGNATSPKLNHVRPRDVDTYEINGILMVRANGKGISLFNLSELQRRQSSLSGWIWKIPQRAVPPSGLALCPDPATAGHFFLCPVSAITMDRYRALLSELVMHCERTTRI